MASIPSKRSPRRRFGTFRDADINDMMQSGKGRLRPDQVSVKGSRRAKDDLEKNVRNTPRIPVSAKVISDSIAKQTKDLIKAQRDAQKQQEASSAARLRAMAANQKRTKTADEDRPEKAETVRPASSGGGSTVIHHHYGSRYVRRRPTRYRPGGGHPNQYTSRRRGYYDSDGYYRHDSDFVHALKEYGRDLKEGLHHVIDLGPFERAIGIAKGAHRAVRPITKAVAKGAKAYGRTVGWGYKHGLAQLLGNRGNKVDQALRREAADTQAQAIAENTKATHRLVNIFEKQGGYVILKNSDALAGRGGFLSRLLGRFGFGRNPGGGPNGDGGNSLAENVLEGAGATSLFGRFFKGFGRGAKGLFGGIFKTLFQGLSGNTFQYGLLGTLDPKKTRAGARSWNETLSKWLPWKTKKGLDFDYDEYLKRGKDVAKDRSSTKISQAWDAFKNVMVTGSGWLSRQAKGLYTGYLSNRSATIGRFGRDAGVLKRPSPWAQTPTVAAKQEEGFLSRFGRSAWRGTKAAAGAAWRGTKWAGRRAADFAVEQLMAATEASRPAIQRLIGTFSNRILRMLAAKGIDAAKLTAIAAKGLAKVSTRLPLFIASKFPLISVFIGIYLAGDRLINDGDIIGAAEEFLAGLAAIVPGWGTALSIAISAHLVYKDIMKVSGANGGVRSVNQNYKVNQADKAYRQDLSDFPTLGPKRDWNKTFNSSGKLPRLRQNSTSNRMQEESDKIDQIIALRAGHRDTDRLVTSDPKLTAAILKLAESVAARANQQRPPTPPPNVPKGDPSTASVRGYGGLQ